MKKKINAPDKEAKIGERMIEVKIRFWTNDIAEGKGKVRPKHAWTEGMVGIENNKAHGITSTGLKPFHSLMDLPAIIEKLLIQHGITLHPGRVMQKYIASDED
jgi:hypothetical protein